MNSFTSFARRLRKNATDTENFLWNHLRAKRFADFKFRRQVPIGPYIVDFVCFEKRVIVECDGGQHMEQKDKDGQRDRWFQNQGYRVLRFWDNQVFQNLEIILEEIVKACMVTPPPPNDRRAGTRGGEIRKCTFKF